MCDNGWSAISKYQVTGIKGENGLPQCQHGK